MEITWNKIAETILGTIFNSFGATFSSLVAIS